MITIERRHRVTLYTDGSCYPNPGRGGYAAIICDGRYQKEIVGTVDRCTNNRAELYAAICGLTDITPGSIVTVFTDSSYIERAINENRLQTWQTNGWMRIKTGDPIQNADLWQMLCDTMRRRNLSVRFRKVPAHKGHAFNERVDCLARKAAKEG